jgi:hypothetical protein
MPNKEMDFRLRYAGTVGKQPFGAKEVILMY